MFGKELRQTAFTYLDPEVTPLNHGSYGLPPDIVVEAFKKGIERDLLHPDNYAANHLEKDYLNCIKTVAEIVKCDYRDLAIVDNATSGVNTVVRSMKWNKGDKILATSMIYPSCDNVLRFLHDTWGVEIVKIEVLVEDGHELMLQKFEAELKTGNIKLCLFDVVTSMPAYLFPYIQLVEMCKKYLVLSLVDGAHAVGLIDLDLGFLQPDYFVSNLHKWYYVPRGAALLFVNEKHHVSIQPMPVSNTYLKDDGDDTLIKKFTFVGSNNYARYGCVAVAKQFRESLGGEEAIRNYAISLRDKVCDWLCDRWGTRVLPGEKLMMANIVLPDFLKYEITPENIKWITQTAGSRKQFFQIKCSNGVQFLRLSFQAYNYFEEYVTGIEFLEKLIEELQIKNKQDLRNKL